MSKKELTKEFLEYGIFEELEPEGWDFDTDGLWLPKQKPKVFKKCEIDAALKKVELMLKRQK